MLRRLLGLIVVVGLILVVVHYWKRESFTDASVKGAATDIGREARELGADAKDKLVEVGEDLRDAKITGAVKAAVSLNRSLNDYPVKVSTKDRVVTLRGRVDRADARTRLVALTTEVPDVQRVVDEIEIGPVEKGSVTDGRSLDDRALAAQSALDANGSLRGLTLRVRVDAGRLVLSGQTTTTAERDLAGVLAREAADAPVENGVSVRPGAPVAAQ